MADVMLPEKSENSFRWHLIEVKSSASVKPYHHDDIAVQAHIAKEAGIPLAKVSLAHIDTSFTYPGKENYQGLLKEVDMSEEVFSRSAEIATWITGA